MTESNIIHETETHWVSKEKLKGRTVCYVWRTTLTHSVRVATFDLRALSQQRAVEDCNRRSQAVE